MKRFNDSFKYATGFVKPKTTSILFDKILISDDLMDEANAALGYAYIPHDVLLENVTVENKFSIACVANTVRGSGLIDGASLSLHEKMKILEEIIPEKVNYKYSTNRNKGIMEIVKRCKILGINVVPVYFSPTEFEKQFNSRNHRKWKILKSEGKSPAISICINNLPEIIEDNLSWEQVLDIRKDSESIKKVRSLKNWLNTDILHKSDEEMKAIIDKAIDDYAFALKKHGILTMMGAISTVSTASVSLLNAISKNGSFDVTGITITAGLSIFAIKTLIDKIETRRNPIALIYDLMR